MIAPEGAEAAEASPSSPSLTPRRRGAAAPAPAPAAPAPAAPTPAPAVAGNGGGERTFVSPVVARIAAEHGVDVGQVAGTGAGGRVTKKDILAFVESGGAAAPPAAPAPAAAPAAEPRQQLHAPASA